MRMTERDKMDAHQRNLLRRLLGIFYPAKIGNIALHERTHTIPTSVAIKYARWRLMGHILRLDEDIPSYKTMMAYFKTRQGDIPEPRRPKTRRGRLVTTIARILDQDLKDFADAAHQFGTKLLTDGSHLKLLRQSAV
jgi:hypothetical protein